MTAYRVVAEPWVDLDVAATFDWYEAEQAGLGREFVEVRRFPYAVYFAGRRTGIADHDTLEPGERA